MKEFLASGQVGNIQNDLNMEARKAINERWERLGLTEGLRGHIKENISALYENEAKYLLHEATDATNSGSFETVVFPIIRRIFSKLLANDIVSVQAMNMPIGKLFYISPVTSERKWEGLNIETGEIDGATGSHYSLMGYERTDRKNGNQVNRFYLPDDVVNSFKYTLVQEDGTEEEFETYDAAMSRQRELVGENKRSTVKQISPEVVQYMKKSLYDLFYNDFLYDNSKGKVTIKVGKAKAVAITPSGDWKEVEDLSKYRQSGLDNSIRNIVLEIDGFSAFNASKLTGPDGNEMDTESFLASLKIVSKENIVDDNFSCFSAFEAIPFRVVTQKYGKGMVEYNGACDAQGKLYIELDLAKPCKEQGKTIDGYIGVNPDSLSTVDKFQIAWAQYDSLELETEIGEVSFKLDSVTVSSEERKLRATWSPELAQDVAAFHNIDAEAELTAILSEQIAAEIDREILRDLRKAAPWQARWDYNGWRRMASFSTNYTQKDWNQMLMTKINQISAQIHKATLRGGANFIVVSSEISAVFDDLEYFHVSDASAESDQYNMGIERIGSLNGRYQVYRDPYAPHWSIIIGHKGKSLLDTGYIYAPYIPMQLTPTIYNPFNFAPVKGIMTRYAKKMVNNRYYGAIRVDGLVTWNVNELR